RPTTSAASSRTAPTGAASPMSQAWLPPATRRTRCGTTSPTKTIGPASAVAEPASSTTAERTRVRPSRTRCPRPRATSSPRASRSSARVEVTAATAPTARNGASVTSASAPRAASEPTTQNRYAANASWSRTTTTVITEVRPAVIAAPASARAVGAAPCRPAEPITCTSAAASAAPPSANQT
ncbi:hypothetical protein N867_10855, partial [Actinotalea fermentans ATCC 43279 = JCM 9966 = DSM 3133]